MKIPMQEISNFDLDKIAENHQLESCHNHNPILNKYTIIIMI